MANENLDIINNALADLRGTEFTTFKQANRFTKALDEASMITIEDGGTFFERVIVTGAPNTGVAVVEGDEDAPTSNRQVTKKVRTEPVYWGAYVYMPEAHVLRAKNKKLAMPLLETHTGAMQNAISQDYDSRLLVGTGSGKNGIKEASLYNLVSLFGPATGTTAIVGAENGLIEFNNPDSQTNKWHNLDRSVADGIYNQYQHEGAWDYSVWADFARLCIEHALDEEDPGMLIMGSPGVYRKFEKEKEGRLQIRTVEDKTNASVHFVDQIAGQPFVYNNRMRENKAALAGTPATAGLTYFLSLPTMEYAFVKKPDWSEFKEHGGTQFSVRQKYSAMFQFLCYGPPANGAITGGGV